ncbi:ABC transporter substrate-binding protein [Leptolyngbya sp. CCY15150]|uniref:ABC transporter substrate-binding protein n=1 Tax=Leptolyngbya sp. CCY15150 TaxID=2767772 RepID=UPI0019519A6C|nr:ABC transporter substrate-binding protein [Leptolyngbya sp. CCY15150]
MPIRRRFWLLALLATLWAIAIMACDRLPQSNSPPLRVAFNLWPGYFPMVLAQERGYFAEQGIEVELSLVGGTIMSDFREGRYDGLAMTIGNAITTAPEQPIRIVMALDDSMGADAVVASSEIEAIADLQGQSVGATLGGFGELFLEQMLDSVGLSREEVTFVESDPSEVPEELGDRLIQAGHTWEPHVSRAVEQGNRILFTSAETPGLITDVVFFKESVISDRPDDVRAFVRACFQAIETWQEDISGGTALIADALDLEADDISLDGIRLLTLADNQRRFDPSDESSLYQNTQLYTDFFLRTDAITAPIDLDRLIDDAFLNLTDL